MDYRYFPEPDLPPLVVSKKYIEDRKAGELPIDRRQKYVDVYGLQEDDARILSDDRILSDYYESLVALTNDPKKSCSYITTVLFSLFEEAQTAMDLTKLRFDVKELARVIELVNNDELSSTNSKIVARDLFFLG